jgi:hypothetical protein
MNWSTCQLVRGSLHADILHAQIEKLVVPDVLENEGLLAIANHNSIVGINVELRHPDFFF